MAYHRPKYVPKWIKQPTTKAREVEYTSTGTQTVDTINTATSSDAYSKRKKRDRQLLYQLTKQRHDSPAKLTLGWSIPMLHPELSEAHRVEEVNARQTNTERGASPNREFRFRQSRSRRGQLEDTQPKELVCAKPANKSSPGACDVLEPDTPTPKSRTTYSRQACKLPHRPHSAKDTNTINTKPRFHPYKR